MTEEFRSGLRHRMLVLPTNVALRLEPVKGIIVPMFVCLACEASVVPDGEASVLHWYNDKGWFACPSCEMELLPREADLLVVDGINALRSLRMDVTTERTHRWRWVEYLGHLLLGLRR